jgi:hypothetical protein
VPAARLSIYQGWNELVFDSVADFGYAQQLSRRAGRAARSSAKQKV